MRKFAVIGHPIGHTMSPFIHRRLFALSGDKDAQYAAEDIAPQRLREEYPRLLREYEGFNITIPHKSAMLALAASVDESAALYGSVNVLNCKTGAGYSTDAYGFLQALKSEGVELKGRVCVLGCGGVARTFLYESARAGCDITIAAREADMEAAAALREEIRGAFPCAVSCTQLSGLKGRFDLMANATPVGMYPNTEASPVGEEKLREVSVVFDAVYNPRQTMLLTLAQRAGAKAVGGMSMLVWQAVKAHEIWDGARYRDEDIRKLVNDAYEEMSRTFGRR